eukprot:COSAG02_NODE_5736_length_4079_cov_3.219598_1_plen_111_part_10
MTSLDNDILATASQPGDADVTVPFNYGGVAQQNGTPDVVSTVNICVQRYETMVNHVSGLSVCFPSTCTNRVDAEGGTLGPVAPVVGVSLEDTALLPVCTEMMYTENGKFYY